MKAVILAAGKGTRMEPLTCTRPKPMVKVANKPFLEYVLKEVSGAIDEAVIIISKNDLITPTLGEKYLDYNGAIKISYLVQEEQLGTGHALLCASEIIRERFLLLNGDCFFPINDLKRLFNSESSLLTRYEEDLSRFGAVCSNGNQLEKIIEKPLNIESGLANAGAYVLCPDIFDCKLQLSTRNEYEITDLLNIYAQKKKVMLEITNNEHYSITYPWDVITLNAYILERLSCQDDPYYEPPTSGKMMPGGMLNITGYVNISQKTTLKGFITIEGPCVIGDNCEIGPRADIRKYTTIGNNCRINGEVKNSLFYDGAKSGHAQSSILDSIIGENTNIGAGTITANLRHDSLNVKSMVKDKLIDTGLQKLGTILGDNVHTGIHTSILPGRKIWPNIYTLPGEVVANDKK